MTVVAYTLAALIGVAIIVIGARFLVAPRIAAEGYGVPTDLGQTGATAYLSVKGVRDIASGLIIFVLMAAGATHLLGWVLLAATVIPVADAMIVLRNGGPRSIVWGVHGGTAAVMVLTTVLLVLS